MRFSRVIIMAVALALPTLSATAANRIEIGYGFAVECGRSVTVGISIENDVDLRSVTIPLVVRSYTAGTFWTRSVDTLPTSGRLAGTLTGVRVFEKGRVDFTSPDQLALYYASTVLGADCLPAGPLQQMTGLRFDVNGVPGTLEIDTMTYAPWLQVQLLQCSDGAPVTLGSFSKGYVQVLSGGHPIIDVTSDSIRARAGQSLQNQCGVTDPENDPLGFRVLSGPGSISANGLWTWNSCTRDTGNFTVTVEVYEISGCGPTGAFQASFFVHLTPMDRADLNCDGVADVFDVLAQINYTFLNTPLPPCQ